MIKALKIVLIVIGVISVLSGLIDIIMPDLVEEMYGFEESVAHVKWMSAIIGAIYIAAGVWVIVASRDPLRHINWVKFVITWCILVVVVTAYSIIQGYVDFSQAGGAIIVDGIFAVALLALYPWRAARSGE